ncbi:formate dehydrogenase accessory sulfurtransferase FdhD [Roseateles sp. 22389]|uniref:formate dehydrogenase accessory sulfurtransferase FdhD n=1 Tax=Roseateles sp. 22389 TaxID=3453916 RepID=UPI003F877E1F
MSGTCALPGDAEGRGDGGVGDRDDDAPLPAALVAVHPTRLGATRAAEEEFVAEEVPVALEYNGLSHAVMLATPLDLEDFALGFSLTEGLLASPADLLDVEVRTRPNGVALQLRVTARCEALLKERRRSMAGRTGCGLCGTDNLDQVFRPPQRPVPPLPAALAADEALVAALSRAMRELAAAQPLQQRTGGIHAAAWCGIDGAVRWVREDVGRHNALDKLIGAMARDGVDASQGFAAVTSRASFEMVQKAALAGMPMLAAVSAPTHLAIRTAQACGLRLAGFVRDGRATLYA